MISIKLEAVRTAYEARTGERVRWSDVADATGISRITISRMINTANMNVEIDNIDLLLNFFQCPIGDLVEHTPTPLKSPANDRRLRGQGGPRSKAKKKDAE